VAAFSKIFLWAKLHCCYWASVASHSCTSGHYSAMCNKLILQYPYYPLPFNHI